MATLGDRIKGYEYVTRHYATRRTPLLIRVDGRSFHSFTKDMDKPFDIDFMDSMVKAAKDTAKDMQGFKVAYIQSDEVTFCLTDYERINTSAWFDYNLSKVLSISASNMSVYFNKYMEVNKKLPVFDSRAFNIPYNEVVNALLWRMRDWKRNSLNLYCSKFFSHKQLHGKNNKDRELMLESIDKNWFQDLTDREKYGTFLINKDGQDKIEEVFLKPSFKNINDEIGHLFEYKN